MALTKKREYQIGLVFMGICTAIILGIGGTFVFWLFYPYQLFTFYSEKAHITTPMVKRGETVSWELEIFHHTNGVRCEVSRELRDGLKLQLNEDFFYITEYGFHTYGFNGVSVPSTLVPLGVHTGQYYVHIKTICHVNPVRDITVERDTEDFTVI